MMDYFDTVFVLLMILFPAVFTLFVSRKDGPQGSPAAEADAELAARRTRLWAWTALAVLAYAGLLALGVRTPAYLTPLAFFALWFLLALPVLQAKDPGWRGVPRNAVRTATLTRRDLLPAGLQRAWLLLTVAWLLLCVAAAAGVIVDAPGAAMWWLLIFPLIGGAELALFYWAGRRSLAEAEPSPVNESAELRATRDQLRKLKLYGWFGAAAVCVLLFSLPAILLLWLGPSALTASIVVGAGGGALAGIGGGVFGTLADLRRAKLNRLCIEQSADVGAR